MATETIIYCSISSLLNHLNFESSIIKAGEDTHKITFEILQATSNLYWLCYNKNEYTQRQCLSSYRPLAYFVETIFPSIS